MPQTSRDERATPLDIRDTLFGDMSLEEWGHQDRVTPPWSHFTEAAELLAGGNTAGAITALKRVIEMPGLEARHYLQGWHHLRMLDEQPEYDRGTVLGVIVEVGLDDGPALLAAYTDYSARFYDSRGTGVVWEKPDASLNGCIDDLIRKASAILPHIGLWDGLRPQAPSHGDARISMLTPAGLLFGQGPVELLADDAMGGPAFRAAIALMQALLDKANT